MCGRFVAYCQNHGKCTQIGQQSVWNRSFKSNDTLNTNTRWKPANPIKYGCGLAIKIYIFLECDSIIKYTHTQKKTRIVNGNSKWKVIKRKTKKKLLLYKNNNKSS